MTLPRFLVSPQSLMGRRATLLGAELHHLRVRRVRPGSTVVLCDAHGHQRQGIVVSVERRQATVELTNVIVPARESPLRLTLAQALVKADKLDLIVEKATELGVTDIVVVTTKRSIGKVSAERLDRWNRIARSASKQCQRSHVPIVSGAVPFATVLSLPHDTAGLLFWEAPNAQDLVEAAAPQPGALRAVVGPEGGFTPEEATHAAAAGFRHVGLGPRILRAETAAVTAVTLCQYVWGDLTAAVPGSASHQRPRRD